MSRKEDGRSKNISSREIELGLGIKYNQEKFKDHTKAAFTVARTVIGKEASLYLYGGAVRNLLLNIETSAPDFDFVGNFSLDMIQEKFPDSVIGRWDNVETIRLKLGTAIFDFTSAENIIERLSRNDINISNIVLTPEGEILDFFGGIDSLVQREIKIIKPERKIIEDPVRILRVFRLASELDFTIEQKTLEAILKHAHLLSNATDIDEDIWQIITLEHDLRTRVLGLLRHYGVERYLSLPEAITETVNVLALEKEIQRCKQVDVVASLFEGQVYLVGGAVRDFIWGKHIVDLDFKVQMPIEKMSEVLEQNGFIRSPDYNTSEGEYYVSEFVGVIGVMMDGVDIHLTEVKTSNLEQLMREGDLNFSCCVYDAKSREIYNPGVIKEIKDKRLLFCDRDNALSDPHIIINALKQISRQPDILIPEETREIIEAGIPLVVKLIRENPQFNYRIESLCGNINSQAMYSFFPDDSRDIFDGIPIKREFLTVSGPGFMSIPISELSEVERSELLDLMSKAYGKHFLAEKAFADNVNSIVFKKVDGKIVSCCTVDGERLYSVAARESDGWAEIIAECVNNNNNVWGTVDCNNPKIQALCTFGGMSLETNPDVIERILTTQTEKYKNVDIFQKNGLVVFRKSGKDDYPQVLVRS